MNHKQALKYASYATLYIWIAIVVYLYFVLDVSRPHMVLKPMYLIPILSTFVSGFYLFNRIKEPWLIGLMHYLLAHVLVLFLFYSWVFIDNLETLGMSRANFTASFIEGTITVVYSLLGIKYILPCFILGGYLSKKMIK